MAFSVIYLLYKNHFSTPLDNYKALYLPLEVITSLGYKGFIITGGINFLTLIIISNIFVAFIALSILIPIFIQWAGQPWKD